MSSTMQTMADLGRRCALERAEVRAQSSDTGALRAYLRQLRGEPVPAPRRRTTCKNPSWTSPLFAMKEER